MRVFFNNCCGRPHAELFGREAFYDLNLSGKQATMATNLKRGAECIVATSGMRSHIVFSWFSFSHEEVMPDESGTRVRVLFGKLIKSQSCSKSDAAKTEPYSVFFDVNGHFKRRAVPTPKARR